MPYSFENEPDFSFSKQIQLRGKEREILYWLVKESGIDEAQKERLSNKLAGWFVSEETQRRSDKLLKQRGYK